MSNDIKTISEDAIQASFFMAAHNKYPTIRGYLFSIPNGGHRHVLEAMKFKATGTMAGAPDMLLIWPKVIGIEFKTATGTLQPAQVKVHTRWAEVGIPVHICRSAEEGLAVLAAIFGA